MVVGVPRFGETLNSLLDEAKWLSSGLESIQVHLECPACHDASFCLVSIVNCFSVSGNLPIEQAVCLETRQPPSIHQLRTSRAWSRDC